jgi:hypothetical protein
MIRRHLYTSSLLVLLSRSLTVSHDEQESRNRDVVTTLVKVKGQFLDHPCTTSVNH